MIDITRKTTAFAAEGYLMLGDLRRLVEATAEFDDSASVEAGMDNTAVGLIDTLIVEGLLAIGLTDAFTITPKPMDTGDDHA